MTRKLMRSDPLNLEEVLRSKSRIRIIKALAMKGPLNISEIRKCTGLNYKAIAKSLEALKDMRVIGEIDFKRTRNFRMKGENIGASALEELVICLGNTKRSFYGNSELETKQIDASMVSA